MKKITKLLVSSFVSFAISFSAFAGELTVSGTAKATYGIVSGYNNGDNALGVENALTFAASGETDGGITWSYYTNLDPANTAEGGAALNDDTALKLTSGLGTIAICISDCGLNAGLDWSANVYGVMTDTGFAEGKLEPVNISSYNNIQYHTPAGMLPFGTVIKAGYATSGSQLINASNEDSVAASTTVGSTSMFRIETAPVDGLKVTASYAEQEAASGVTTDEQKSESGAVSVKYAVGSVTLGAGKTWSAPRIADAATATTTIETIENTNFSIGFALNDATSVSYSHEKSVPTYMTSTTAHYDLTAKSIQAAYSMGGMTLSVARTDYDNIGYANSKDATETMLALTLAF